MHSVLPGSLSVGRIDTKISLPSAPSPFLRHVPRGGQAWLGEPPRPPGKHGVMLEGLFFVWFVLFIYLSVGKIAMVTWGKGLASISVMS